MVLSIAALRAYASRVDATLVRAQREAITARAAERLGIAAPAWEALLASRLDGASLRDIHRAVTGVRATIRRAEPDGTWTIAAARAGHLRSRPQCFRLDDHVESAWDHSTLKRQIAAVLAETVAGFSSDPIARAASLVWALTRAQPFLGDNERVALVAASRAFHDAGLPWLGVEDIVRDSKFDDALVAATSDDRDDLEGYLAGRLWDEALATSEWLQLPRSTEHRTLRDEHDALRQARERVGGFAAAELDALGDDAAAAIIPCVESKLGTTLGHLRRVAPDGFAERLQLAAEAGERGHPLCPHEAIVVLRSSIDAATGLELVLVLGTAGRGLTGAASLQLALEVGARPTPQTRAPAILLVPDEAPTERSSRIAEWAVTAVDNALRASPIRC
jgi:hypothetical protein